MQNLNLKQTLETELLDLSTTEDVFDQLLELHQKVKKTYGLKDFDEEDFGLFIRKTFRRRDYKHFLKTMTYQKSKCLKSDALDELETQETQEELKRLIKSFSLKRFEPSKDHQQECLGLLDDLESLAIQPDQELTQTFKNLFKQTYGDQND